MLSAMAARELQVLARGLSFLEAPRWHEGRLWVSDFYTHRVLRFAPDGTAETVVEVPGQPSGLGWLPDGRLLIASMRDRRLLRLDPAGLALHADLHDLASWHLNDLVVDTRGRAYVGNFGFDLMAAADPAPANLVRVDPDGTATVAAEHMLFPNGSVITPDGRTLIVAETVGQRLTAFDIAPDGSLVNRRVWAAFGEPPTAPDFATAFTQVHVAPDGICLDAEGCVWFADAFGQRAVRVREGGEIVDEVSTGQLGCFACMLGGDDGTTLFLCCAPTFVEHEASANHRAQLLSCRVEVPHAGLP